jgi:glutamine amidotransferase
VKVAIIDYGSGNLRSAQKSFERAMREAGLSGDVVLTSDVEVVRKAERIVLPGVGAFRDCRDGLKAIDGMWETLNEQVKQKAKPFLGICVGMQLMADHGLEGQKTDGFAWILGDVRKITLDDPSLKIPHMGWNTIEVHHSHPLFHNIKTGTDGLHAYFVHSYHLKPEKDSELIAESQYGGKVTAIVGRDNMVGTQFHPEKSQKLGLALISNFLTWKP